MACRATLWVAASAALLVPWRSAVWAVEPDRLPGQAYPLASCLHCELICRAAILDDGVTVLSGHGAIADVVQSAEVAALM